MGGHGSGGMRPGAGRRPDGADIPSDAPLAEVLVPAGLTTDEREVWEALAPHALRERTLTEGTSVRFRMLCRAIVRERQMDQKIQEDGWTYIAVTVDGSGQERQSLKAHPLCGPQRGMMQRIETGLQAFKLAPVGKPIPPPESKDKPKNALESLQSQRRDIRAVS